jgi:hypothetical protein
MTSADDIASNKVSLAITGAHATQDEVRPAKISSFQQPAIGQVGHDPRYAGYADCR